MASADLDRLERYLVEAPVIVVATHTMGGGGHPNSFLAILEGGVGGLVKPIVSADSERMACREVAAWRLARALEWTDLVSATVLRDAVSPYTGDESPASLQVLWPASSTGAGVAVDTLPDRDTWRASVFDALIRASDRSEWTAPFPR